MPTPDPLAQVHELNRLFLRSLQWRDAPALSRCGFPAGAVSALHAADERQLDGLAEFPRALFDLTIEAPDDAAALPMLRAGYTAQQIIELTIVHGAWTIGIDSAYHARLFFGLPTRMVHTLRTTPLSSLPVLALASVVVTCAFPDAEWLWRELLTETRPEVRRRLILIALQPSMDGAAAFDRVAERSRSRGDFRG